MLDVQNLTDDWQIDIDKVGVKNIRYPITVLDKAKGKQRTVASVNMYVNLPHHHEAIGETYQTHPALHWPIWSSPFLTLLKKRPR